MVSRLVVRVLFVLVIPMTILVNVVLLSADPNVLIRRRGRWSIKLMALIRTTRRLSGSISPWVAGLSAVNSTLVLKTRLLYSVPSRSDPLMPAQLISVIIGIPPPWWVWWALLWCPLSLPKWFLRRLTWRRRRWWLSLSPALLVLWWVFLLFLLLLFRWSRVLFSFRRCGSRQCSAVSLARSPFLPAAVCVWKTLKTSTAWLSILIRSVVDRPWTRSLASLLLKTVVVVPIPR